MGVGTTAVAALLHDRRSAGADLVGDYLDIAQDRILLASKGALKIRPMERPIYRPPLADRIRRPPERQPGLRRIDEDVVPNDQQN
jgi:adenine-specific DNA-methyltransferase